LPTVRTRKRRSFIQKFFVRFKFPKVSSRDLWPIDHAAQKNIKPRSAQLAICYVQPRPREERHHDGTHHGLPTSVAYFASRAAMKNSIVAFWSRRVRLPLRPLAVSAAFTLCAAVALPAVSMADENGVSFWLPGLFSSLVAVPQQQPGWGLTVMNYYDSVGASGSVAASREITIGRFNPNVNVNVNFNVNVNARVDVGRIIPSYAFATPVFGGQLTLGDGVSFWLPGLFSSLVAVPQQQPGWGLTVGGAPAGPAGCGAAARSAPSGFPPANLRG
jgi:hypothetical protein